MEFTIDRDTFLRSLSHANGIIEKKTTFPILSNILIEAKDSKIKITATDLDIIYFEEISPQELEKEGTTTTSASTLYDILRKLKPNAKKANGRPKLPVFPNIMGGKNVGTSIFINFLYLFFS